MIITIDFDGTLQDKHGKPRKSLFGLIPKLKDKGVNCVVFTTRKDIDIPEAQEFVRTHLGYSLPFINTNHTWKAEFLMVQSMWNIKFELEMVEHDLIINKETYLFHIDDNPDELHVWGKRNITRLFGAKFVLVHSMNKFLNYVNTKIL